MHSHSLSHWAHEHSFLGARHDQRERRTWSVVALTAAMMILEIIGGMVFGSIALVADGWHMATHVLALAIAVAVGAAFIRVNVLCSARVTDQGILEGIAHDLLRDRVILHGAGHAATARPHLRSAVRAHPPERPTPQPCREEFRRVYGRRDNRR